MYLGDDDTVLVLLLKKVASNIQTCQKPRNLGGQIADKMSASGKNKGSKI